MEKPNTMEDSELRKQLTVLKEELEELQIEKNFVLGQTGLHVSSSKVAQQAREYEEDTIRLQGLIAEIEGKIKTKV
ncbi:MAG: hypothetical protein WHF31_06340 [Candidatus Dehalobacter alkaniphilus]|uniref:hypothetical protein n=1 Tax=Dehalobacter sp. DCM TaxID=2907827 RepID=UPI003081DCA4|nr:hypothetical protein LPY66_01700 [Dehalobacter sp. DCM]